MPPLQTSPESRPRLLLSVGPNGTCVHSTGETPGVETVLSTRGLVFWVDGGTYSGCTE